nr:PREDICTED: uncharacterized protein LOC109039472 isoform X1 [Bemisia tabaci]
MSSATSSGNIVVEWLKSLHLGQYAESFLDNGYDDLEICKQVGDPDLDAIGVFNSTHRHRLLQSVRTLREEGAASVYFTLEESAAIQEECLCDSASIRSSRASSGTGKTSDKELPSKNSASAGSSSTGSVQELHAYHDEYEEGKAELVRIPRLQLKSLLKEKLSQDGIQLSNQPYSTMDGQRGYLEGLASRYADMYKTHYRDVLEHLEDLRRRAWGVHLSPSPRTPPGPAPRSPTLTTSLSQPIYVPGKYSPSSCLSDREEDEIYGFAGEAREPVYGVYEKPKPQRRVVINNYQNCLNPRSAYFYEFPPTERSGKKKTTFTRFLKHLKAHRKEKSGSPKHPMHRALTPDRLDEPPGSEYDRLKYFTHGHSGFEETIHRLKLQEAMKKKERFDREHEEILRDIRHGLSREASLGVQLRGEGGGGGGGAGSDDTYMYDDDMIRLATLGHHWYDEPPYESDPEDFLMVAADQHNQRVCYTMKTDKMGLGRSGGKGLKGSKGKGKGVQVNGNGTCNTMGEGGVISLRLAGDISLPPMGIHQRGLILPQAGPYPPTVIPLTRHAHANNRESGDYAASDIQSVCSRLSSLSMETSRSEACEPDLYHRLRPFNNGNDSAISPGSSDCTEEDMVTLHSTQRGSSFLAHRVQGLKFDRSSAQRKHTHRYRCDQHTSSIESLPSGSSTQPLMQGNSSEETGSPSPTIARAKALVDYTPSLYEKDALKFKKGDVIEVISMSTNGLWQGRLGGKQGYFKFTNVQLTNEGNNVHRQHKPLQFKHRSRHRPQTLEQLLETINMKEHMSIFMLNGYEDLESFCAIQEKDLDYLGILDIEQRALILAAVEVMHGYESPDNGDSSGDEYNPESFDQQNNHEHSRSNNLDSNLSETSSASTRTSTKSENSHPMIKTSANNVSSVEVTETQGSNTYLPNIPTKTNQKSSSIVEITSSDLKSNEKVAVVKYICNPSDLTCETNSSIVRNSEENHVIRRNSSNCCTFSEKSSDSGISSSSVSSSAPNQNSVMKIKRKIQTTNNISPGTKAALIESPTRSYVGHFVMDSRKN